MLQVVSDMYADYLRYTNRFRHIPYYIDALKLVERRLLLTLHENARSKSVKSAKIVGYCVGDYHPHGDVSTYDALVGLVQRGFAKGDGNWSRVGFVEDDNAGAMRYTNVGVQKGLNDIITEFLDYVPWEEIEYAKEPIHFSNPIPMGLVGRDFISGIGVDTIKCPRYESKDLFSRLIALLTNQTPPTIIPNVPGCNVYEDYDGEFEYILTRGEGRIQIVPKITKNFDHMVIRGRSPLKRFGPLIAFNERYYEANKKEYFKHIDLCAEKHSLDIEVQIYPTKNGQIHDPFVNQIWKRISQRVNVKCNFINKDLKVEQFGIDKLLLSAYDNWKKTHLIKLNDDHRRIEEKIFEMDVIQVVRDIMQHNPNCKKVDDVITTFIPHQKAFPMISPDNLRKVIGKYSIKVLIEKDLNKQEHTNELQSIQLNIQNIDQNVLDRINEYMK